MLDEEMGMKAETQQIKQILDQMTRDQLVDFFRLVIEAKPTPEQSREDVRALPSANRR